MSRFTQVFQPLLRSVLFLSAITISSVQAADKIDLIIDTDPGADDVVALLLALASPEQLNVRAITTVAGNVRLDKTSRNARLAREWAGREEVPVYAGAPKPLVRTPMISFSTQSKAVERAKSMSAMLICIKCPPSMSRQSARHARYTQNPRVPVIVLAFPQSSIQQKHA